jgi:hypothetical protein
VTVGSDNVFPKVILDGVTSDPAAPSNDNWKLYAKMDGVYALSSNTTVGPFVSSAGAGSVATDSIWDAAGDTVVGTGANTAARRAPMFPIALTPPGCAIAWAGTNSAAPTNATADIGRAAPIIVPGYMRVRSMWIHVSTNGSGSVEWGLFDCSTTLTAATKVAGGSAAPGGTGWREITATGAPVAINSGTYILIVENPAANASTISTYTTAASMGIFQAKATYTWDDTPDLTSGWSDSSLFWLCYIEGDLDTSSTRW